MSEDLLHLKLNVKSGVIIVAKKRLSKPKCEENKLITHRTLI